MLTNIRLFFVLMLVFRLGEVVFADKEATESVEIRANVQLYVEIELLDGKNGIDLLNEKGEPFKDEQQTIKFKLKGNFSKANLSFKGTDGLDWFSDNNSGEWMISHESSDDKFRFCMNFKGYGNEGEEAILGGKKIEIDDKARGKELGISMWPIEDCRFRKPGLYKGQLRITVEASD